MPRAAAAGGWQEQKAGIVTVYTSAAAEQAALPGITAALVEAQAELLNRHGLRLCAAATVYIHSDLDSFMAATGAPWHVIAMASPPGCRIDMQRSAILQLHGGIRYNLRHELYHLAQPDGLERWRAEAEAELFAGGRPKGPPLDGLTPGLLDALLASPPDPDSARRARDTALHWLLQGR